MVAVGYASLYCLASLLIFSFGAFLSTAILAIMAPRLLMPAIKRLIFALVPALFLLGQYFEATKAAQHRYFPASPTLRVSLSLYDSYLRRQFSQSDWECISNDRLRLYCAWVDSDQMDAQLLESERFLKRMEQQSGMRQIGPMVVIRDPENTGQNGQTFFRLANSSHADAFRPVDRHELAHLFLIQQVDILASPPQPLVEGWAIYWEENNPDDLYQALHEKISLYGDVDIAAALTVPQANIVENESYLIGGPLVHFLISEFGVARFCDVYIQSTPQNFADLCQQHFDESLTEISDRFLQRVKRSRIAVDGAFNDIKFANAQIQDSWDSYISHLPKFNSSKPTPASSQNRMMTIKRQDDGQLRYPYDFARWIVWNGNLLHSSRSVNGERLFAVSTKEKIIDAHRAHSNSDWVLGQQTWWIGRKFDLQDRFCSTQNMVLQADIRNIVRKNQNSLTIDACRFSNGIWKIECSLKSSNGLEIPRQTQPEVRLTFEMNPDNIYLANKLGIRQSLPEEQFENFEFQYSWNNNTNDVLPHYPASVGLLINSELEKSNATFDVRVNSNPQSVESRYFELLGGASLLERRVPSFLWRNVCWSGCFVILAGLFLSRLGTTRPKPTQQN